MEIEEGVERRAEGTTGISEGGLKGRMLEEKGLKER